MEDGARNRNDERLRKVRSALLKAKIWAKVVAVYKWADANWKLAGIILTLCGALIARGCFGVSLMQPFEELAVKQAEYREKQQNLEFQKTLVRRHIKLGNDLLDNERYSAAKKEFEAVRAIDKTNPDAQIGLYKVSIYEALAGDDYLPELVDRQIRLILDEKPQDPHALVLMGTLHYQVNDLDGAEKFYQQAIASTQPHKPASAYFNLGQISMNRKDLDKAIEMYKEAVNLSVWNERFINNLAYAYLIKEDFDNAITNYEKVLDLDNQYILPNLEISFALRFKGDLETASAYQEKLIAMLKDEKITSLDKNKGAWTVQADKETLELFDLPQKKAYALLTLSSTLFLLNQPARSQTLAEQALGIETDLKSEIKLQVGFDLKKLTEKQPGYKNNTEAYSKQYLEQ
jgi:tetratricopeptide (TPR) repeat protein